MFRKFRKFRTKEWAVMIFIANDNNLGEFTFSKIDEIASVGSTRAADVIIQFDTPGRSRIRRFRLSRGRRFRLRHLQTETNTGDKETLIRFLDFTREDFPSRRSLLAISNHGSGLRIASDDVPFIFTAMSQVRAVEEEFLRPPIFRISAERQKLFCSNTGGEPDLGGDALDALELKAALAATVPEHGRLDLIVFDACLMSTFELAYQIRHTALYAVASQSNIPIPGCRFAPIFEVMRDQELSTAEIAKSLVENAIGELMHDEYSAMAALDLERASTMASAISMLANALLDVVDDEGAFLAISLAHLRTLTFIDSETIDLFDFCRHLEQAVENEAILTAAAALRQAICNFVIANNPRGAIVERARGISITLPRRNYISEAYRQLDFARETTWVTFLERYLKKRFPT